MLILGFEGRYLRFEKPRSIHRHRLRHHSVKTLESLLAPSLERGYWLGGYLAYPGRPSEAQIYLEVHDQDPRPDAGPDTSEPGGPWLQVLEPAWNAERYIQAFQTCRQALRRGETYQINLTFPMKTRLIRPLFFPEVRGRRGRLSVDELWELWRGVGAQSPRYHAGFIYPEDARFPACRFALLSWSPESWIRGWPEGGSWHIESRPMKGTAARSSDPSRDLNQALELFRGTKTRAENLMITDMVRNEFSELVAQRGGRVSTDRLFEVEALTTLWQMTSTVRAAAPYPHHPFPDIVRLLFPPASITGAPKRSTMAWIHRIEGWERSAYTGVSFVIAPDGRFESSVLIRTLQVDIASGRGVYGVGGGVVWDSQPAEEYREALSKAVFLSSRVADFDLIETLRWDPERGLVNWPLHARRITQAARLLRRPIDTAKALGLVREAARNARDPLRIRLALTPRGDWHLASEPLKASNRPLVLAFADRPIEGPELLRRLKTSRRDIYEAFRPSPGEEALLWDPEGWVLEGTFTNVAFFLRGHWLTPSLKRPLLNGVMRQILIRQGRLIEADLHKNEVLLAERAACFNSLRGWMEAVWPPTPG